MGNLKKNLLTLLLLLELSNFSYAQFILPTEFVIGPTDAAPHLGCNELMDANGDIYSIDISKIKNITKCSYKITYSFTCGGAFSSSYPEQGTITIKGCGNVEPVEPVKLANCDNLLFRTGPNQLTISGMGGRSGNIKIYNLDHIVYFDENITDFSPKSYKLSKGSYMVQMTLNGTDEDKCSKTNPIEIDGDILGTKIFPKICGKNIVDGKCFKIVNKEYGSTVAIDGQILWKVVPVGNQWMLVLPDGRYLANDANGKLYLTSYNWNKPDVLWDITCLDNGMIKVTSDSKKEKNALQLNEDFTFGMSTESNTSMQLWILESAPCENNIVATPKNEKLSQTVLFPNPASNLVNLDLSIFEEKAVNVQFFNVLLQQMKQINIEQANKELYSIPINDLSNGQYFLRITDAITGFSVTKNLIITK